MSVIVLGSALTAVCAIHSTAFATAALALTILCLLGIALVSLFNTEKISAGIDVHSNERDERTIKALALLKTLQGYFPQEKISRGVDSFTDYLENKVDVPEDKRRLAIKALKGAWVAGEPFGLLLGDHYCSSYNIPGYEVIARHWFYAKNYHDPKDPAQSVKERENAKLGMITALSTSYEGADRICNRGKVQLLVVKVLQGRLPGVDIDQILGSISAEKAIELFFSEKNCHNQHIAKRSELMLAANTFCKENSSVERRGFIAKITEYAALQEMEA